METTASMSLSSRALTFPQPAFSFDIPSPLTRPLTFSAHVPDTFATSNHFTHAPSHKRAGPLRDPLGIIPRKKRRLRMHLVTSPLSRPFSAPASHIVDRGSCKVAVWAAQQRQQRNAEDGKLRRRCSSDSLLRKAAVLNTARNNAARARRASNPNLAATTDRLPARTTSYPCAPRGIGAGNEDERDSGGGEGCRAVELSIARPVVGIGEAELGFKEERAPRFDFLPFATPDSAIFSPPLGVSNYDALDEEVKYVEQEDEPEYFPHPDWATPIPPRDGVTDPSGLRVSFDLPPLAISLPPTPSPSPPKSAEWPEQKSQSGPVISPNFNYVHAEAWRQLDEQRPPSPPDEEMLRILKEKRIAQQEQELWHWMEFR